MKYVMSILVLLTMFYSAPIFGQSIVTIRWGGNLTKLGGLVRIDQPRKSISMGVSVAIPIRDRFSLQFGGDYVPKGVREDLHYGHLILDIDYVEFSGLGIVTIISPRRAPSLSILAGPTVAFKVRNEGEDPLASRYGGGSFDFNTLDFGIAGGIGTQMAISKTLTVSAQLRYTLGIRSINKTVFYVINAQDGAEKRGLTNHAISFCIGLGFPVSRLGGG